MPNPPQHAPIPSLLALPAPAQPAGPELQRALNAAAVGAHPIINQEPMYVHFRRMNPQEFEGATDPLEAEDWLTSLQVALDFMNWIEIEKAFCASYVLRREARYWWETLLMRRNVYHMNWNDFTEEFKKQYCDQMTLKAQHNEFDNLQQGNVIVTEACRKFDHSA